MNDLKLGFDVERVLRQFHVAMVRQDTDTALSCLTTDVIFLLAYGAPLVGREAVKGVFPQNFEANVTALRTSAADIRIATVDGAVVLASGTDSYVELSTKNGGTATLLAGPMIYVFRKEHGDLKLARALNLMHRSKAPETLSIRVDVVIEKFFSSGWDRNDTSYWSSDRTNVDNLCHRIARRMREVTDEDSISTIERNSGQGFAGSDGAYGYGWYDIVRVALPLVVAGGAYAYKKVLDVAADIAKLEIERRLNEKHGQVERVTIAGPDGQVVSVVERNRDTLEDSR